MINNYIKNLKLSSDNSKLTIYFNNDVFNCDNKSLNTTNFRLHLLANNVYETIELNNIIFNDKNSYTLLFNINNNFIDKDSAILIELLSVYNNKLEKLNNYQKNNYIYVNFVLPELDDQYININVVNEENTNKISYANRSSPLLAYNHNLKNHNLRIIYNYDNFYGKKIDKYPSSYYTTSYNKIFKPS